MTAVRKAGLHTAEQQGYMRKQRKGGYSPTSGTQGQDARLRLMRVNCYLRIPGCHPGEPDRGPVSADCQHIAFVPGLKSFEPPRNPLSLAGQRMGSFFLDTGRAPPSDLLSG